MLDWVKRLFSGDSNDESETKSEVDPIQNEPQRPSSDDKKMKRKHAKEYNRRQRARESRLSRDLHKGDSRWVARGGFSFGGGGA